MNDGTECHEGLAPDELHDRAKEQRAPGVDNAEADHDVTDSVYPKGARDVCLQRKFRKNTKNEKNISKIKVSWINIDTTTRWLNKICRREISDRLRKIWVSKISRRRKWKIFIRNVPHWESQLLEFDSTFIETWKQSFGWARFIESRVTDKWWTKKVLRRIRKRRYEIQRRIEDCKFSMKTVSDIFVPKRIYK